MPGTWGAARGVRYWSWRAAGCDVVPGLLMVMLRPVAGVTGRGGGRPAAAPRRR